MSSTSTTFEEAKIAIAGKLVTFWNAATASAPLALPNEDFTPPKPGTNTPWARLAFRHNSSFQQTQGPVGCRKFERQASAFIQVFRPEDEGEENSAELVDLVLAEFEGARITGTTVCFLDVIPREVGPSGKWYQVTIEATFRYTEVK